MDSKQCSKCKEIKPLSDFGKRSRNKDGLQYECKPCDRAISRAAYQKHKESRNQKMRDYYQRTQERRLEVRRQRYQEKGEEIRAKQREYAALNKEERLQWDREYYRNNKDVRLAGNARRRARQIQRTPSWANEQAIRALYKEAKVLEQETGIKYHVDHIIPLNGKLVSGLHVESNLQVIPANENLSKSNHYEVA